MELSNREITTVLNALALYYGVTTTNISSLKKCRNLKENNTDKKVFDELILYLENDLIITKSIITRYR